MSSSSSSPNGATLVIGIVSLLPFISCCLANPLDYNTKSPDYTVVDSSSPDWQRWSSSSPFRNVQDSIVCLGSPDGWAHYFEQLIWDTTEPSNVQFYFATRRQRNYTMVEFVPVEKQQPEEDINGTMTTTTTTTTTTTSDAATADVPETEEMILANLESSDFDIGRDTYVLVHGFMSNGWEPWLIQMKDALLDYADANVIVTDWQNGSNTWNYISAASSTRVVGETVAKLLSTLKGSSSAESRGKIHVIGHSLGAHISGRAAHVLKKLEANSSEPWLVERITGLDPARQCFNWTDASCKLSREHAPFVDVIHTNGKNSFYLGLGIYRPLGHADFYPNGGRIQPGCEEIDPSFWAFLTLPAAKIKETICNHGRAYRYFTESIVSATRNSNCTFHGYSWDMNLQTSWTCSTLDARRRITCAREWAFTRCWTTRRTIRVFISSPWARSRPFAVSFSRDQKLFSHTV
ncbi:unnamed protein product [Trichogramma brassicae]|uniref:phospholipase A1 n=1 Tax=Trichogramma brassicae TaxID=86971 RepID=A0A6H5ISQ1_9HYME|nr:unnamed protein product [Trichogramma brassicae]